MSAVTRRSLLPLLAGIGFSPVTGAQTPTWRPGVQLYTIRDAFEADSDSTLKHVSSIGYREVEPAGSANVSPTAFREMLKRHSLAAPSMHASYERLARDLDGVVREAEVLGAAFLVCPWVDAEARRTVDDWKQVCRALARTGRVLRDRGLTLAYHNHDYEFLPFAGGATPFDLLIGETDPQDVKLELDVYWTAKAGRDPARTLKDNEGRVALVHLKDMAREGAITELGAGVLDFARIIPAALAAGARHLFVEQDDSSDPLHSIAISLRFLKGLPPDARPGAG